MTKKQILLSLSSFCMVTIMASEPAESPKQTASEPQAFVMNFDSDKLHENLPISSSDLAKTIIVDRWFENHPFACRKPLSDLLSWGLCNYAGSSNACRFYYDFRENQPLNKFLFLMQHDEIYANKFWNIQQQSGGVRDTVPAFPYSSEENIEHADTIPCIFCPNVKDEEARYQHALVFNTDNVTLCDAIKIHNNAQKQ